MDATVKEKLLPSYLSQPIYTGHYYGELHYEEKSDSWIIKGEPVVCQMAKKLFPGSSGRGKGEARFKRNKRTNGDLNWLMQRYPLRIFDESKWETDYRQAVDHFITRQEIAKMPQKITPPPLIFRGELREFQKEAVSFLIHNAPTCLFDDMGLGKTVEALAWIATLQQFPGIIVCPKSVVRQWAQQIKRFMDPSISVGQQSFFGEGEGLVHIISGLTPYELPPASFYIVHYGLLRGWKQALPEHRFKFCVFDEIQELRHKGTEKYSAASLLAESIENQNRIGMSGTPIYNRGGEIWNVTNIVELNCLGDWESFTREWCYGYGNDIVSDPEELGAHLRREGLMLRRVKEDVLQELPPKRRIVQEIDHDETLLDKSLDMAYNMLLKLDDAKTEREKSRIRWQISEQAREATGIAKAKQVAAFVRMLLESGESVTLYGWHHAVYEIWKDELNAFNPVMITGKETDKQKDENKMKFMNGDTNLIILSLRVAAGMDGLQERANINVFGELDWSPGIHSQCEDRTHRMGQRDSVISYYLVSDTGCDDEMMERLGFKTSQFIGIIGGNMETEDDKLLAKQAVTNHLDIVIQRLRQRQKQRWGA